MVKGILIAVLFGVMGFYGGRYYYHHHSNVERHEHLAFVYGYNSGVFDAAGVAEDHDLQREVCPHEANAQKMEALDLPDFDVNGKLAGLHSDLRSFCEDIRNDPDTHGTNLRRNDN